MDFKFQKLGLALYHCANKDKWPVDISEFSNKGLVGFSSWNFVEFINNILINDRPKLIWLFYKHK
jgi:hypothetical protein